METHFNAIIEYVNAIKNIKPDDANEHTYRTPLQNLIEAIKFPTKKITPIHEGKSDKLNVDGTPDFFIYEDYDSLFKTLVGFIECKKIFFNLDTLIKSKQIEKYSKTSENIIITNYREFILLQKGKVEGRVTLIDDKLAETTDKNCYQNLVNLLLQFYSYEYQYIKTKKSLTLTLANQSFYYSVALREYIENKDNEGETFYYKFKTLFDTFQKSIQYSYILADFCDIYAQSLVYGLMLSRLDNEQRLDENKRNYLDGIPDSYKLLYEFLETAYSNKFLPIKVKQALTNIGKNLNLINVTSIQKEFNKENNGKSNIAVYLYEEFLKEYDNLRKTEKRKEGGVYYTPKEATSFITRSVNELIQTHFGLSDGYLADSVKVLDFACGTGTFIDSIFDLIINDNIDDLEKRKIKEKIKKDYYGFEILFTPYIVAHTILTKHLKDKGINFSPDERLGIYLTNTLDISQHSISGLLPNLRQEHEKASKIKNEENILAIVGNPPYFSGKSEAQKGIIDDKLYDYKKNLNEKNIKPLNDMYIKFIRFAEYKIEQAGYGIVGIITSNSFLNGLVHRQMRKHLYDTFDEIYILNLHGNTHKGERDKNIFDIMVGVNITFLVKNKQPANEKKVQYYSTLDNNMLRRDEKLAFLSANTLSSIKWKKLNPETTKNYWFIDKDLSLSREYEKFYKITNIFTEYSGGIQSSNDAFCIKYTLQDLENLKEDIAKLSKEQIIFKYEIKESSNWQVEPAKDDLLTNYNPQKITYRPFDMRFTSLCKTSKRFLYRPFYEITKHFNNKSNIGISFVRQLSDVKDYSNMFISENPIEYRTNFSYQGGAYFAPLFLYKENGGLFEDEKVPNLTNYFINNYLKELSFNPSPEDTIAYIYAVMHSPIYRSKYIEFLKTDFPAIPMTKNEDTFNKYAKLGEQLINAHLLQNLAKDNDIKVSFVGNVANNFAVTKITLDSTNSKLMLTTANNNIINIDGVSEEIYNFEIGSYKPIDKWLKYRIKDKVILSTPELEHIKNMIIAIKTTIATMKDIEALGEEYLQEL